MKSVHKKAHTPEFLELQQSLSNGRSNIKQFLFCFEDVFLFNQCSHFFKHKKSYSSRHANDKKQKTNFKAKQLKTFLPMLKKKNNTPSSDYLWAENFFFFWWGDLKKCLWKIMFLFFFTMNFFSKIILRSKKKVSFDFWTSIVKKKSIFKAKQKVFNVTSTVWQASAGVLIILECVPFCVLFIWKKKAEFYWRYFLFFKKNLP